eukprot:Selendium_serpulae@DN6337_c1_g1_i1.p1
MIRLWDLATQKKTRGVNAPLLKRAGAEVQRVAPPITAASTGTSSAGADNVETRETVSDNLNSPKFAAPVTWDWWWLDQLFPDVILPSRRYGLFGNDELCHLLSPAYLGASTLHKGGEAIPRPWRGATHQVVSVRPGTGTAESTEPSSEVTATGGSGASTMLSPAVHQQRLLQDGKTGSGETAVAIQQKSKAMGRLPSCDDAHSTFQTPGTLSGGTSRGRYLVITVDELVRTRLSITRTERQTKNDLRQFQAKIESTEKLAVAMFREVENARQRERAAKERKILLMNEKEEMLKALQDTVY